MRTTEVKSQSWAVSTRPAHPRLSQNLSLCASLLSLGWFSQVLTNKRLQLPQGSIICLVGCSGPSVCAGPADPQGTSQHPRSPQVYLLLLPKWVVSPPTAQRSGQWLPPAAAAVALRVPSAGSLCPLRTSTPWSPVTSWLRWGNGSLLLVFTLR